MYNLVTNHYVIGTWRKRNDCVDFIMFLLVFFIPTSAARKARDHSLYAITIDDQEQQSMIGDFLLTTEDTDPFVDDPQQLIPSSCWDDGSTPMILPLHPTIQNQQGDNNDIPPHLSSILLKGAPRNSSATLVAWAMALAHRIDRRHNCPQCQSHPETCQCNHVDVILCRPSPQQQPAQQPQQEQEPTNSSNNNNSNDTLSLLLDRLRASNNNASSTTMSETQQRHALGRIRVHTVQTRSEFLQCILSLQHRPMTEQPRYGILVDQLASLMMPPYATTTSNNHHHTQHQHHYPYPYPSSSSSLADSIMVLSQLGKSFIRHFVWIMSY